MAGNTHIILLLIISTFLVFGSQAERLVERHRRSLENVDQELLDSNDKRLFDRLGSELVKRDDDDQINPVLQKVEYYMVQHLLDNFDDGRKTNEYGKQENESEEKRFDRVGMGLLKKRPLDRISGLIRKRPLDRISGLIRKRPLDRISGLIKRPLDRISGLIKRPLDRISGLIRKRPLDRISGLVKRPLDRISGLIRKRPLDRISGLVKRPLDRISGLIRKRPLDRISGLIKKRSFDRLGMDLVKNEQDEISDDLQHEPSKRFDRLGTELIKREAGINQSEKRFFDKLGGGLIKRDASTKNIYGD